MENKVLEDVLTLEEFQVLWKIKAKEISNKKIIIQSGEQWTFAVLNYLEYFFINHLCLDRDELIEFGYQKEIQAVFNTVKTTHALQSIVFVGANHALNFNGGLLKDAYAFALVLYEEHSQDVEEVKAQQIKKHKEGFMEYGYKIQNQIPDETIMERLAGISKGFSFSSKEINYIKESLTTGLDSSIVFEVEGFYKNYVDYVKSQKQEVVK